MVRFPLLFLSLLASFAFPQGAEAQGVFEIMPDTLFTDESGHSEAVMFNATSETVVLDSMSIYWGNSQFSTAWEIEAVGNPTDGVSYYFHEWPTYSDTLTVDLTFAPGDTLLLTFLYDWCTVCLSGWVETDTLVFHSNGQFGNDSLLLDFSHLVANEVDPEEKLGLSLKTRPNPFAGPVRIELDLDRATYVAVAVFDVQGRQVAELERGPMSAGEHVLVWDGSEVASGVYLIRAEAGDASAVRLVTTTH